MHVQLVALESTTAQARSSSSLSPPLPSFPPVPPPPNHPKYLRHIYHDFHELSLRGTHHLTVGSMKRTVMVQFTHVTTQNTPTFSTTAVVNPYRHGAADSAAAVLVNPHLDSRHRGRRQRLDLGWHAYSPSDVLWAQCESRIARTLFFFCPRHARSLTSPPHRLTMAPCGQRTSYGPSITHYLYEIRVVWAASTLCSLHICVPLDFISPRFSSLCLSSC